MNKEIEIMAYGTGFIRDYNIYYMRTLKKMILLSSQLDIGMSC